MNQTVKMVAPLTPNKQTFDAWAFKLIEVKQFQAENEATTWARKWWAGMDRQLQNFMLFSVCGDMGTRYHGAAWSALPVEVRDDVMLLGRTIERSFRGAPWR